MVGLTLLACAALSTQGVLEQTPQALVLHADTRDYRLVTEGDAQMLQAMDDCTVHIDGVRRGRSVRVQDFEVIAAQDGSAPFVGTLRRAGERTELILRGSGMRLIMVGPGAELLAPHIGQPVMILGFASGPHELTVMSFVPLAPQG